jgi:hypothetical protein
MKAEREFMMYMDFKEDRGYIIGFTNYCDNRY